MALQYTEWTFTASVSTLRSVRPGSLTCKLVPRDTGDKTISVRDSWSPRISSLLVGSDLRGRPFSERSVLPRARRTSPPLCELGHYVATFIHPFDVLFPLEKWRRSGIWCDQALNCPVHNLFRFAQRPRSISGTTPVFVIRPARVSLCLSKILVLWPTVFLLCVILDIGSQYIHLLITYVCFVIYNCVIHSCVFLFY